MQRKGATKGNVKHVRFGIKNKTGTMLRSHQLAIDNITHRPYIRLFYDGDRVVVMNRRRIER